MYRRHVLLDECAEQCEHNWQANQFTNYKLIHPLVPTSSLSPLLNLCFPCSACLPVRGC
jgi:hypothetical protein